MMGTPLYCLTDSLAVEGFDPEKNGTQLNVVSLEVHFSGGLHIKNCPKSILHGENFTHI